MKHIKKEIREIKDIQNLLNDLYSKVNKDRAWDYLYGYLCQCSGVLSKQINNFNRISAKPDVDQRPFIVGISWLFSIASYFEIDISESYMKKFPEICPYCIVSPCICFKTNKMPGLDIPIYKLEDEKFRKYEYVKDKVDRINSEWVRKNIKSIYPANEILWYQTGPRFHFTKLIEELSELHEAISKHQIGNKPKEAIQEEIADVFAWFMSIWDNLYPELSLEDAMIDYYITGCPQCSTSPCICSDRKSKSTDQVNLNSLIDIKEKISKLSELKIINNEILDNINKALEVGIQTQSEPTMKQAAVQTKTELTKFSKGLKTVDTSSKEAASIITSILKIIEKSTQLFGYLS